MAFQFSNSTIRDYYIFVTNWRIQELLFWRINSLIRQFGNIMFLSRIKELLLCVSIR